MSGEGDDAHLFVRHPEPVPHLSQDPIPAEILAEQIGDPLRRNLCVWSAHNLGGQHSAVSGQQELKADR
jgi:hypothetical protein